MTDFPTEMMLVMMSPFVRLYERAWYYAHRFPSVLPRCTIWAILFVCVCVNLCIIQDFKLYTCMVSIYMYSTYTYKTNEQDFSSTQHGIEKGDWLILYQYNYQYNYL